MAQQIIALLRIIFASTTVSMVIMAIPESKKVLRSAIITSIIIIVYMATVVVDIRLEVAVPSRTP